MIAKIYTDEDISPLLAQLLRAEGVDAVAAHEVRMIEKDDIDHLRYATQEQRVLVTFNVGDFMRAIRTLPNHAGVILCPQFPKGTYPALSQNIIDKLTIINDWSQLVIWATLR